MCQADSAINDKTQKRLGLKFINKAWACLKNFLDGDPEDDNMMNSTSAQELRLLPPLPDSFLPITE